MVDDIIAYIDKPLENTILVKITKLASAIGWSADFLSIIFM
jgi:hypothetical protein